MFDGDLSKFDRIEEANLDKASGEVGNENPEVISFLTKEDALAMAFKAQIMNLNIDETRLIYKIAKEDLEKKIKKEDEIKKQNGTNEKTIH